VAIGWGSNLGWKRGWNLGRGGMCDSRSMRKRTAEEKFKKEWKESDWLGEKGSRKTTGVKQWHHDYCEKVWQHGKKGVKKGQGSTGNPRDKEWIVSDLPYWNFAKASLRSKYINNQEKLSKLCKLEQLIEFYSVGEGSRICRKHSKLFYANSNATITVNPIIIYNK